MPSDFVEIKAYINGCHMMRNGALERLSDAELQFSPGGENLILGELFRQLGEHQHSYSQSLLSLKQDWSYQNSDAGLASNLLQLRKWFDELDQQMQDILNQLDQTDMQTMIDRSNGTFRPIISQLDIYTQTLLIFLGKIVIYFKAMQKPLPPSIAEYIG
jgi:hypothetical protein